MSSADILVVVDTSGSTADYRMAIERSLTELRDGFTDRMVRVLKWSTSVSAMPATDMAAEDWSGRASFADLAQVLTEASDADVVVYTDACLHSESEASALSVAANHVADRAAGGRQTHVVLVGDAPDTANAALLHSWTGMPWQPHQTLALVAALEGDNDG